MTDPNFKGLTPSIRRASPAMIRQLGYTEQRYVAEQRRIDAAPPDRRNGDGWRRTPKLLSRR